jgi:hypothetical protein
MGEYIYRSTFLDLVLVGGEWSASRSCRFTPGERAPVTHWIGGSVDPRAGLDDVDLNTYVTSNFLELKSGIIIRVKFL